MTLPTWLILLIVFGVLLKLSLIAICLSWCLSLNRVQRSTAPATTVEAQAIQQIA